MSRRHGHLAAKYRAQNGYRCMVPGCGSSLDAQSHHIVPVAQGGEDKEENLIVLCGAHHRHLGVHKDWQSWRLQLLSWKFYYESGRSCEEKQPSVPIAPVPSSSGTGSTSTAGSPVGSEVIVPLPMRRSNLHSPKPKKRLAGPQKPLVACAECGTEFRQWNVNHKYCSLECRMNEFRRTHPAPVWTAQKITANPLQSLPIIAAALTRICIFLEKLTRPEGNR